MSMCSSGLDAPCHAQPVTIDISPTHPLLQLGQVIPWSVLPELWQEAFTQIGYVRKYFAILLVYDLQRMPWNIRRAVAQVKEYCSPFFLDVAGFICGGKVAPKKALSLPRPSRELLQ